MNLHISRRVWLSGLALIAIGAGLAGCLPTARPQSRFGFTISPPTADFGQFERDVRAANTLGAGWVRFGVIADDVVESWFSDDGVTFDESGFAMYRRALKAAVDAGLAVCLLTVDGVTGVPEEKRYLNLMGQYWSAAAERLGRWVLQWQVFNEANDLDFRTAAAISGSYDTYLSDLGQALGRARSEIHRHAPHVAVTTNAGGYPVDDSTEANWQVFFGAVADRLDLVTVDVYPVLSDDAIRSLPHRIDRLAKATGKPIAVGEFGLQTGPGLYTEAGQVVSLSKTIGALAQTNAAPVIAYRLRDDGAVNDDGFGLIEQNGTPKSSLKAVSTAIAEEFPEG